MAKYVIKDGCLLSMDPKVGNHARADLLIEGDRIAEIGDNLRVRDAELIDATDTIVMPGFVDGHHHLWQSLFRGLGDVTDSKPEERFGPHHSPDDVYAATLIGLVGSAEAGITTVVDWADIPAGHLEAALQAHSDAGVRTVLVHARPRWEEDSDDWRARIEALAGSAPSPLRSLATAPREPYADDLDRAAEDWSAARQFGLRLHTHLGMAANEGGVAAALASRRLLDADVTLVHCTNLEDSDFDAIASASASVVLAASSEMAAGAGPPPVQKLIDRGIRPGLGVDRDRLAPGDIFAPMRAVISIQHATSFDLKLAGKGAIPQLMSTRDAIRFATIDGARAVGLGGTTGSLTPGKQADVIVLRGDRPNIAPVNDPIGAVVWGMDTSNLDWVFVAGSPRMRNGVLEADREGITAMATEARRRVGTAAGILAGAET